MAWTSPGCDSPQVQSGNLFDHQTAILKKDLATVGILVAIFIAAVVILEKLIQKTFEKNGG